MRNSFQIVADFSGKCERSAVQHSECVTVRFKIFPRVLGKQFLIKNDVITNID